MQNYKPLDAGEIDETLTRVVTHGRDTYLMFPYIDGRGISPKFQSVSCVIGGAAATVEDFSTLSARVRTAGDGAVWCISFNTPWLLSVSEVEDIKANASQNRTARQ